MSGGRYHDDSRALQDRFDTTRLADRIDELLVKDHVDERARAFIEARDLFFLATCDDEGRPQCSYKGGTPGFVRVLDDTTLGFPSYDGNGMFLSLGNVARTGHVGMLFVDFEEPGRLRVNGTARVSDDPALLANFPGAQLVVVVDVREVFPNCSRYIHHLALVERSPFVPAAGTDAPIPGWKQQAWARDHLAADDPARRAAGDERAPTSS
jgi:predicted pyridoxine 5'-phosphate oxidase superfamily flavin-nucleotide-binding protein